SQICLGSRLIPFAIKGRYIPLSTVMRGYLYLYAGRCYFFKMVLKKSGNLLPVLVWYQSHGNFGIGLGRNYGFCTFAGIAAPNSVYVQRRTDGIPFIGRISFFPIDILYVQGFFIKRKIKGGFRNSCPFLKEKFFNLILKPGISDM